MFEFPALLVLGDSLPGWLVVAVQVVAALVLAAVVAHAAGSLRQPRAVWFVFALLLPAYAGLAMAVLLLTAGRRP